MTDTGDRILEAFPGLGVIVDERAEMAAFFDRLWTGKARGYVALGFGRRPYYDERGKYCYTTFSERFFRWPEDLGKRQDEVLVVAATIGTNKRRRAIRLGIAGGALWLTKSMRRLRDSPRRV